MKNLGVLSITSLLMAGSTWLQAIDFSETLEIPDSESLLRIRTIEDLEHQNIRDNFVSLATEEATAIGEDYTILTDHEDAAFLAPLEKLAAHREGSLVQVSDLSQLYTDKNEREKLKQKLQNTKYLAIAPRSATFSENTVLALFQILTELDADPQIDVFPSFLVASSGEKLAKIVNNAIAYEPLPLAKIQPVAISLVDSKGRINALQKAGYFRAFFAGQGKKTPTYLIYRPQAHDAPSLGEDLIWYRQLDENKNIVETLPEPFEAHFLNSNLVIMHGHGTVGESCRIATEAIEKDLSNKVILSGSCFSAAPTTFDWPLDNQDKFQDSTSFSIKAMEQGAISTFGHMRLSNGFRYQHPVFESLYAGDSNGEAYHKLINAALKYTPKAAEKMLTPTKNRRKPIQNSLLYILFGDPALAPYQS